MPSAQTPNISPRLTLGAYAKPVKVLLLEPSDSQEADNLMKYVFDRGIKEIRGVLIRESSEKFIRRFVD